METQVIWAEARNLPVPTNRNLLRQAVKRPEPEHEVRQSIATMSSPGKQGASTRRAGSSAGPSNAGAARPTVGDVEVGIARRQPSSFVHDGRRHRQLEHLERAAVGEARPVEPLAILGQRLVVFVAAVGLDDRDDEVFGDEAREVVDVAVGVVADDAVTEPDDLRRPRGSRAAAPRSRPASATGCGSDCSRHCSVVSSAPAPLTSMEPPSSTMPMRFAAARRVPRPSAAAIALSRSNGGYLPPQAL